MNLLSARRLHAATLAALFAICLFCSCGSERCECPEPQPARPQMAYVFQQAVNYCMGCDYCYYLYWYFECDGDTAKYLDRFDSRDDQDQPPWLTHVAAMERCYPTRYCPDPSWGYYTDPSVTPRQNEEAEEAAVWFSGSLVAPENLYEILRDDLALIRTSWRESIPQVDSISFQRHLHSDYLSVVLYRDAYERFTRGEYHDWDSLNTVFHVTEVRPLSYATVFLIFRGRYYTPSLAQVYKTIPSVFITESVGAESGYCEPSTVFAWPLQ